MRARRIISSAALCVLALGAALVVALVARPAAGGHDSHGKQQERFLYVATIAQSATDPDFVAVIGADPRRSDFGKIVNRIDMPNVGDVLHHFGYSADQKRLIVPGLFSNRIHIFKIKGDGQEDGPQSGQRPAGREERLHHPARHNDHCGRQDDSSTCSGRLPTPRCPAVWSRSTIAPAPSRGTSARARCAVPATSAPSTCTTSPRLPGPTAESARPSGPPGCAPGVSTRPASATRSPSGTFDVGR